MQSRKMCACKVLLAVEKRVDELNEGCVDVELVKHARVDFKSGSKETLLAKPTTNLLVLTFRVKHWPHAALSKAILGRDVVQVHL